MGDKLKRLTQQIEDRISKTIDGNSQILKKLRTPDEKDLVAQVEDKIEKYLEKTVEKKLEKKVEKVPLLPLPIEEPMQPDNDGDYLLDLETSEHEEASEVSETKSSK